MILTVTPNSAVDRVVFVRGFRLGEKTGAEAETFTPAGKGVGASLSIHALGGATLATGFAAGRNGRLYRAMLDEIGIRHDFVETEGETRITIVLVDLDARRQSTISVPTLRATPSDVTQLLQVLGRHGSDAWAVAFGGSLPPGLASDAYADLVRRARCLGLYTLLDTSGEPLRRGVAGLPHVLKVNDDEVSSLAPSLGDRLRGRRDDLPAAVALLRERIGAWAGDAMIVTLGSRGVLAVTPDGAFLTQPPQVPVVNTAGAGDAFTGGVLTMLRQGAAWCDALRLGTAAAAAAVMNQGTGVFQMEQVERLVPQIGIESL
jgi:1-phosphofructokinase family hexose kinase